MSVKPSLKPTEAWAVVGKGDDIQCRCVFLARHDAKNLVSYVGESIRRVYIVPADEWERLNAILTRAVGALAAWENMYPDSGPKAAAQVIEEYEGTGGRNSG